MFVELSAQALALVVISRLYLQKYFIKQPILQLFLAQHLKGIPRCGTETYSSSSTLLSLCESLSLTLQKYGCRGHRRSEISLNKMKMIVKKVELQILITSWSIDSVDQLLSIAEETYAMVSNSSIMTPGGHSNISQRSVLGSFIHSLVISLKLLDIEESSKLYYNFRAYRESSYKHLKELEQQLIMQENGKSIFCSSPPSQKDLELIRSGGWVEDPNKSAASSDFRDQELFNNLMANIQTIEECGTHFESLPAIFTRDYIEELVENQIHLLQRYGTAIPSNIRQKFMQIISPQITNGSTSQLFQSDNPSMYYLAYLRALYKRDYRGAFDSLHRYFDYMVSKGSRYFYHFALVSKASLHQLFGENEKALDTIEEAISVARENKDNSTLTYILSWLFDCIKNDPALYDTSFIDSTRDELQILDPFVRKSSSVSLSLSAISFRSRADHLMNTGACFAKYYECFFRSSFLSIHDHVTTFIGACHVGSDLWDHVGVPHLTRLYNELGVIHSESNGSAADISEFKLRERRQQRNLNISFVQKKKSNVNEEAVPSQSLQYRKNFQSIESSLQCGHLSSASELLESLTETRALDKQCLFERQRLLALFDCNLKNYSNALALADFQNFESFDGIHSSQSQLTCILRSGLLRNKILIEAGSPLSAYSSSLRQMQVAKESSFLPFYVEGCCTLLQILRRSDCAIEAYDVAYSMIPSVFTINDPMLQASFLYALASTAFQLLNLDEPLSNGVKGRYLHECLNFLSMSISGFKSSGDLSNLWKCFDLEKRIASKSFDLENQLNADLLSEFDTHSRKGLDLLKTRVVKTRSEGFLERNIYK